MRRLILLAALALISVPSVWAQVDPRFGAVLGLTTYQSDLKALSINGVSHGGNEPALHAGLFGDLVFGRLVSRASVVYVDVGYIHFGRGSRSGIEFYALSLDFSYRVPLHIAGVRRSDVEVYPIAGVEMRRPVGGTANLSSEGATYAYALGGGVEVGGGPFASRVFAEVRASIHHKGFDLSIVRDRLDVDCVFLRVGLVF